MTRAPTTSDAGRERLTVFGGLALGGLGLGIWASDVRWMEQWEDAVPAMLALPLAAWLGMPWQYSADSCRARKDRSSRSGVIWLLVLGAGLYLLGAASEWMIYSAAGWTCLLAAWLQCLQAKSAKAVPWLRLLPLALLAFPWLMQCQALGWWFRLSGAATAEFLLLAMQWDVTRQGTELWLSDACVTVGEACSGLRGLQAMLVGGSYIAIEILSKRDGLKGMRYWIHLPILLGAAWLANTSRVVVTAIGTQWAPHQWLEGSAHQWQGWLLLCLAFLICQWVFGRLARWQNLGDMGIEQGT